MTTVIEHGTLSGAKYRKCRCLDCANANAEYQTRRYRKIGYGTWQPLVDASTARAHVEELHAQGMTWRQIADAAGVGVEYLCQLRISLGGRRRFERIRPDRSAALLAVQLKAPQPTPLSNVPAIGATRRLRALRANGWPSTVLAERSGIARPTIGIIVVGARPTVFAATAAIVAELYDDLHDQDPRRHGIASVSADRSILRAKRLGWAPPRAWDGIDIDDPAAEPGLAGRRRYTAVRDGDSQRLAIIENTAELVAQGLPRDVIADRLGVTWDNVRAAHSRAGVPLPEPTS